MNFRYFSVAVCLCVVSLAPTAFAVQSQQFQPTVRADTRVTTGSGMPNFRARIDSPRPSSRLSHDSGLTNGSRVASDTSSSGSPFQVGERVSERRLQPIGQQQSTEQFTHPAIREELFRRVEMDQVARQRIITSARTSTNGKPDPDLIQDRINSDRANRQWLADLLQQNENRWIGKTMVGAAGSHAAWLIVQHSDDDPTFQVRCLNMMRAAAEGEVALVDIAFLTDEVLVARDEKQMYGTQVQMQGGLFRVAPVKEPQNLNARRAALGLESIEDYLDSIRNNYQTRSASNLRTH